MMGKTRIIVLVAAALACCLSAEGQSKMIKRFFMWDLPYDHTEMDRRYFRYHTEEAVRWFGPWLTRYWTWRCLGVPETADRFNAVRYRVTELWFYGREAAIEAYSNLGTWRPQYTPEDAYPGQELRAGHAAIMDVPAIPTERFLDQFPPIRDEPYILWLVAVRYPQGVSVDEGERWYRDVHAPELAGLPGVLRFVSYRAPDNRDPVSPYIESISAGHPWVRLSEIWFDSYAAWHQTMIESPPELTPPPWSTGSSLETFYDLVSAFIHDAPELDMLREKPRRGQTHTY
jgi:hypothetical protein